VNYVDVISLKLVLNSLNFSLNDPIAPKRQVGHLYVRLYAISCPVDAPLAKSGEKEDSLFKRLARNRTRIDADPSNYLSAVDDSHFFSNFSRLNSRALPRWTTSYDYEVIIKIMSIRSHVIPSIRAALQGVNTPGLFPHPH
jgi:hypothetical protein